MEGTVKFFNEMSGYGFITPTDEGKEVFVHKSALEDGVRLKEGDKVTFDVEEDQKGPKAVNVKKA